MAEKLNTSGRPRVKLIGGEVFGRLTYIADAETIRFRCGQTHRQVICQCSCGNKGVHLLNNLRRGLTKSCGCLSVEVATSSNTTHGQNSKKKGATKTYRAWRNMISRCTNSNVNGYHRYGGRGITICDRWLFSFENFLSDMGCSPKGMSIERINNNGNYEPGNCRWATQADQSNNQCTNRWIEYGGRRMTLAQWAREIGMSYDKLRGLLDKLTLRQVIERGLQSKTKTVAVLP